jgi:predicted nucleotidyltransferase component of viral defense system
MLRKEAVVPETLTLLQELQNENLFSDYYLAGGTAVALQLGHRVSSDIDLFTMKKPEVNNILHYMKNNYNELYLMEHYDDYLITLSIGGIKIQLLFVDDSLIEKPEEDEGIRYLGLKDLSAMKLSAAEGRKSAKDFVDIVYLLKSIKLEEMFEYYKKKYIHNDIIGVKKALVSSKKIGKPEWDSLKMLTDEIPLHSIPSVLKNEVLHYNAREAKNDSNWY